MFADIAQEVERSIGSAEVTGPTPVSSLVSVGKVGTHAGDEHISCIFLRILDMLNVFAYIMHTA